MSLFREEVSEYRRTRLQGRVVLSQPLSTQITVSALLAIIIIIGVWVSLGTYARIETVSGILTTDVPTAKILVTQAGTITELDVSEGQLVERGDRLAVVDLDRRVIAGKAVASRGLDALGARQEILQTQAMLSSRRANMEHQRLLALASGAEQHVASLRQQIALQEKIVASNQSLFDKIAEVVERGFVSRIEYERRHQSLISSQKSLADLKQQLVSRQAEVQQARAQIGSLAAESAQNAAEIQSNMYAMAQQRAELEGEQGYIVTAPVAGRVTALQTAPGRMANPAVPLMVIVPNKSILKAELYAPTRAIGFAKPGQETRILFDAFPYQRFGSYGGRIQSVSRTALDPREAEVPIPLEEAVYKLSVKLDRQFVMAYGETVTLQPGMTLKANIVLERQTFLDWLLQPLNAVLKRGS